MKIKNIYKAKKGLIRVDKDVIDGIITNIRITGDFFMYPEESLILLENRLKGVKDKRANIEAAVKSFYSDTGTISPFVTEEDFIEAITGGVSL